MDFDFNDAERTFAEEVRRFLRANPPETFAIDGMDAGYGSGANSRAFLKALGAQGWLSMCWPKTYGGREEPMFIKLVLMEELALAGAPFGPLARVWQTADAIIANGTPGMDIRPIRSLTGEVYHHEVFLDDVRVSADLMLGPEGDGFQALLNGLDADRFWGRFYKAPALERVLRQLVSYANTTHARGVPLARDPGLRRRLAAIAADIAALRLIFYRTGCLTRDGAPLTYETAMAKVYADETGQKLARLGMDLLGVWGPLREGSRWAKLGGQISHLYLTTLGHTIAGGTAEILRTSIAVRGLGLPAEPRTAEPRAR